MEEKKDSPRCSICTHEDREGIELLAIMSCASWNICRERINNTFGTSFSTKTIRNHMTNHEVHRAVAEQGIIMGALRGEDEHNAIISVETMLQTLLVQGFMDLAKGQIRCKSVSELLQVGNMLNAIQDKQDMKTALEAGDINGFYLAMAAYGTAMRDTLSPDQLNEVMLKANALGAYVNIGNMEIEAPIEVDAEEIMSIAVEDYKRGRSRSRQELIEAGVFDGLELP